MIPTARAARLTMDREGIRRLAAEQLRPADVAVSVRRHAERSIATPSRELGLPCVVKPVMSSSGKGQSVVRTRGRHRARVGVRAAGRPRRRRAHHRRRLHPLRLRDHAAHRASRRPDELLRADRPPADRRRLSRIVAAAADERGGARRVAAHRARDHRRISAATASSASSCSSRATTIYFSEVSPRPHDTGLVTLISQDLSEFALHARAILGLPIPVDPPARPLRLVRAAGRRRLEQRALRERRARARPSRTRRCACSANRKCAATAAWACRSRSAATIDEARAKARKMTEQLKSGSATDR